MQDNAMPDNSETATFERIRAQIAESVAHRVGGNKDYPSVINGLSLFHRDRPAPPALCLVETSIVVAVQGEKQILVAGEAYPYNTSRFLITSLDIPAYSQVLEASPEKPCLGFAFRLDLRIMAELMAQDSVLFPSGQARGPDSGIGLGMLTTAILEPFKRLIDLLDEPESVAVLAPLIEREIHYRLLRSDQGARLGQIASVGSQGHRVSRAITWLKEHYAQPLRVDELASCVQMSPSSLYQHFRQFTAMSPLQYQKWLRLTEARRLMFSEGMKAASAAFQVGYESPSHFSREYNQLFGLSPKRDIEGLRKQFGGQGAEILPAAEARRQ
ncbi:AraC family transcriptional regulator [Mangrovibacter plantisponsor]|uniref:AraC-like DNA-binding protein n=1 Tax=Mangrovibacter plantisponsor TaxID=451513 RepID=A0A317Q834_9ENTR|nr:AraC family transcriptional regulator [Mangrovibacter plantisponsor]PWW12783.1 AraC-like DNA-binding protein [Mangrovibacter plantisponsor]